ncbi:MAG TPA: hypothetical protein VN700_09305 [Vicinamibacterales bacterium]|nr:hypothetical protein [Vicinamibacterales bacterium]
MVDGLESRFQLTQLLDQRGHVTGLGDGRDQPPDFLLDILPLSGQPRLVFSRVAPL